MAIDNLNYYSSGLPAGQLTDKYSSQPGCLKSKNLDIFSSSKSVKATAWSNPTTTDADIVKQDGKLVLKTDGKVYERENGVDTLVVDPSVNFPVYKVSYNGKNGTYEDATWGTVQDMSAIYEGDELKSFVVFTDRASYNYSAVKYVPAKSFGYADHLNLDSEVYDDGYLFRKSDNNSSAAIGIVIDNPSYATIPLRILAQEYNSGDTNISLDSVILFEPKGYYYDAQLDGMAVTSTVTAVDFSFSGSITDGITLDLPIFPTYAGRRVVELRFKFTKKAGASSYSWTGDLYIDMNGGPDENHRINMGSGVYSDGDYNEYYNYLPIRERHLVDVGDYGYSESYWIKGQTFQPLYKWASSWIDVNGEKKTIYDFVTDMGWENDPGMDVVGMIVWNEQIYMIGNLNGDGYIIPCDLTGGRGTPYIAYGCEFKGVTNIDYLLYLVGENRGISTLWVFNQQELVPVVGGKEEKDSINLIKNEEQYRFDGKIVNRRKNLILTTGDNRIFQYGQTFGGKGGAFINELPGNITSIKTVGNDLVIDYNEPTTRTVDTYSGEIPYGDASFSVKVYYNNSTPYSYLFVGHSTTAGAILDRVNTYMGTSYTGLSLSVNGNKLDSNYPLAGTSDDPVVVYVVPDTIDIKKSISYQDDTPIKNYKTEWQAVYPIVLGNHLLEKEESDLYASYILPASSCKLEFWGMANHYHFWTFTSEDDVTLSTTTNYKLKGSSGTYNLKFLERNGNQYTFRLEGDLPVQTANDMKITDGDNVDVITYSDFNHFRKIGVIETDKYCEGEFRFHNLNNKLELPKSYSLQIMVKGKGTVNYTPELFSVDLVVNQRNRG